MTKVRVTIGTADGPVEVDGILRGDTVYHERGSCPAVEGSGPNQFRYVGGETPTKRRQLKRIIGEIADGTSKLNAQQQARALATALIQVYRIATDDAE